MKGKLVPKLRQKKHVIGEIFKAPWKALFSYSHANYIPLSAIKQLNMEKGGKTKSKERKVELPMLQVPINLMLNYLIWAHFVYNAGFSRILQSAKREPEDKIETSDWWVMTAYIVFQLSYLLNRAVYFRFSNARSEKSLEEELCCEVQTQTYLLGRKEKWNAVQMRPEMESPLHCLMNYDACYSQGIFFYYN